MPIEGAVPRDSPSERDLLYFEGDNPAGIERHMQICRLLDRLGEFQDYEPYMNQECLKLWKEASDLANIEIVWKDKDAQKTTSKENQETETYGE